VVCVTGAGGSIGSELCRQILRLSPRQLIVLEQSEPSLYAIEQELRTRLPASTRLQAVLGSAADQTLLERLFAKQGVQVVFHAAAYKHVPLVELNPLAGVGNNVLTTRTVCSAAQHCGVEQVLLISTDKAVRPTNVMGASKRLAELVVQAFAAQASSAGTRFAMVRFGNVLGSSGSVVPLFRQQIAAGGPITLTHPDIIRYFMTIPEAAQLVLQAAVVANPGDVVLLDMGEPVRIRDLAEQMVQLSGLSLRDANHPDGDIEIHCSAEPTRHPLIYRARERAIPPDQLWPQLEALEVALERHNTHAVLALLQELIPEWDYQKAESNV
jgi:FlaA1/EpsC-like NDP-sugar epimerase